MNFLYADSLRFAYTDGMDVLRDIGFSAESGEHIALVGPNGCGKSTLFDILSGYRKPCHGTVYLEGRPVRGFSALERARKIAFVPQAARIPFPYTCLETVLMGLAPFRSRFAPPGEKDFPRAEAVMRETGVWDFAEKNIQDLSGGQVQRVIFTRALLQARPETAAPPRLLLLDEPFSELDIGCRIEMMKILDRYARDYGITVIGIHHDLNMAGIFARRIIALQNGRLAASGSPEEVFTEHFFAGVFRVKVEIIPHKGFLFYDSLENRGLEGTP
ncbi:MAG: ABC transporter ATP-binding protein [Treponema sp.]|nr:ABC transporter ATP-binding protein [Treponema sp.]